MRILISPAKKMRVDTDTFACDELPVFTDRAEILMEWIRSLSYDEQKELWNCNDKIAEENAGRFACMDLRRNLSPAILSYDGIQYTYMAPVVFEDGHFDYVQEHLRILSGFYGVVKPLDGVVPYRLEMQAKIAVDGCKSLYDFWGDSLYITCTFGELVNERIVQKGVYVKMARGEMVRYMAEINVVRLEQIRDFNVGGYEFDEKRSSDTEYVFLRSASRQSVGRAVE